MWDLDLMDDFSPWKQAILTRRKDWRTITSAFRRNSLKCRRFAYDLAFLVLALGLYSLASTIQVPQDQPTIQAGINAANNGDTVLVAPGTYYEQINFSGKNIVVESQSGASVTTIDASRTTGPVVRFISGEVSKQC
jgi:hypothetical protein